MLRRPKRTKPLHDITGKRFGNLEVIRMEQDPTRRDGMWFAICKCHVCGKTNYKAAPYWIKKGSHTKSCGCDKTYFKRQSGRNSSKFRGHGGMNSRYVSNAERRAKKLNIPFNLDAKFLWDLYISQNKKCALSGVLLSFPPCNNKQSEGNISLDRIDSKGGYTKSNVQWVHKIVNTMKMKLAQEELIDWCKKISEFTSTPRLHEIT